MEQSPDSETIARASEAAMRFDMLQAIESALDTAQVAPKVTLVEIRPEGLLPQTEKVKSKGFKGTRLGRGGVGDSVSISSGKECLVICLCVCFAIFQIYMYSIIALKLLCCQLYPIP